jgi:hypothetical protein
METRTGHQVGSVNSPGDGVGDELSIGAHYGAGNAGGLCTECASDDGMKASVVSAMILLLACGTRHGVPQGPQDDAGTAEGAADAAVAQGSADAGAPPSPDAGTPVPPLPPGQWVRDSTVAAGYGPASKFHSPQPEDLWLEIRSGSGPDHVALFHHQDGAWPLFFQMDVKQPFVWIRSPGEVWILDYGGLLQVASASAETITSLAQPGRYFSAMRDDWLAYHEPSDDPSATCQMIGFLRRTDAGFIDIGTVPACWPVTDIYGNVAVTSEGEILVWDGSRWSNTSKIPSSDSGPFYGFLSGGPDDLYLVGYTLHGLESVSYRFSFGAWTPFSLGASSYIVSLWARPWGPRWALDRQNAFEWDGAAWRDQGPKPTTLAGELPGDDAVGADGTNVFATGEWDHSSATPAIWIYRYVR